MEAEFITLEEKIQQTVQLCQRLRDENRDLRTRLSALQEEHRAQGEKIDSARSRIENLLGQIPE
jgi:cell division protein ZapB